VYSHDIEKFMREKPPDLKGACPFGGGGACRFGKRCRFYGSHGSEDEKAGEQKKTSIKNDANDAELNALSDETQRLLAKCAFALPRSDAVLKAMGVPVKCVSRTQAARVYGASTRAQERDREGHLGVSEPGGRLDRPGWLPPPPDFRGKLYVAPLTTVGNMPFRRACVRAGADVTVSEMAMAANLLKGDRREWALVRRHASETCFGVQVCGGYPDLMARVGELLDSTTQCDFVDINMGCPIDGVCNKGAGASLFKDKEGLARCEKTVRCASRAMRSTPLTIKIRMGYEDDPAKYVAHEVLARARGWGAAAATLHGRTRQQRYSRDADWEYIERCARVAARDGDGLPLVGNGDVFGWADYARRMRSGHLATCMIGRGALVKPWVFTEIKERRVWDISATERLAYFDQFARDGLEHWGADEKGVETTRRFMLEWMSYTHRYVPVGLIERGVTQKMTLRPMPYEGRNELETMLASDDVRDWIALSEMFLGKPAKSFAFVPKHASNSYSRESAAALRQLGSSCVAEEDDDDDAQNG
jgi:tRNA-dihydrouridine synthase 3